LSDATDEAEAAKAALERLEAGGHDLKASNPQLENAVLVAISQVVAPVAEQMLAQIQQKQVELLTLQQTFLTLTDDETTGVPLFNGEVERLNAKDTRAAPVAALRERFFHLDSKAGQDHAKAAAVAWRRWRESLRSNPDAPLPSDLSAS
jgi:hypothetical protein